MDDSPYPLLINLSALIARPTGISTYALNLLPHLRSLHPQLLSNTTVEGFECHPIPNQLGADYGLKGHGNRLLWIQTQLPKYYQRLGSRLLFSPLPEAPLYSPCRTVVTVHDLIPLRFPKRRSPIGLYFRHYVPSVLRQAQHIVCDSEATAADIMRFFQITPARITTIPLGYDAEHFRYLDLPLANYFFYVGRHEPHKNLGRLLSAFQTVSSRHPDVELWIGGSFDQRYSPQYIQQAETLGIRDRVRFLDYLSYDQLPTVINQAIALVFPSLWEGFGLPVLEAMACGTPVITSNLSSLPEVAGDATILIDPYNVEQLADAMVTLVKDDSLRQDLRRAGLAQAQQFSWEKTGQQTCEILKQFL